MLLLLLATAQADECAPSWAVAWPTLPRSGETVPANARFRVTVGTSCGERLPGPAPVFRLSDRAGELPIAARAGELSQGDYEEVVLVPLRSLEPGPVRLEGRMPTGSRELGPWTELASLVATAALDRAPPTLTGTLRASASQTRGLIPLSPCEVEEGPVVKTRLVLSAPVEAGPLLYVIERKEASPGSDWSLLRFEYPSPAGTLSLDWEDASDWGAHHLYRAKVLDAAGHETATEPVPLRTPSK